MAKFEGAGGYGATSTLNTDSRQGRFYPHTNIYIYRQHPNASVKCLTCLATWPEGDACPATCKKKDDWIPAEEILKG